MPLCLVILFDSCASTQIADINKHYRVAGCLLAVAHPYSGSAQKSLNSNFEELCFFFSSQVERKTMGYWVAVLALHRPILMVATRKAF